MDNTVTKPPLTQSEPKESMSAGATSSRSWDGHAVAEVLGQYIHSSCQKRALSQMNEEEDFISMEDANLKISDGWRLGEIIQPPTIDNIGGHREIKVLRNSKKSEYNGHYEKKLFGMMEEFVNLLAVVDKLKDSH